MSRYRWAYNILMRSRRSVLFSLMLGVFIASSSCAYTTALSSGDFNAGNIIGDAVFTNFSTMSVQDIQNFLNAKVPTCDSNGSQPYGSSTRAAVSRSSGYALPLVCLKDYYENPSTHANNITVTDGQPVAPPAGSISSAQIIYNAAQTYHINPQVLLVTLQKEQGLVTDDWPWANQFNRAMGYACPDSANGGCDANYNGLYNQITTAAKQFRRYLDYPNNYNYVVGNDYILYSPAANCGGSTVAIQNQATAALYDYTPYQPISGALNGISSSSAGSSVTCGSYGNRNFWWYFNTWFGSTQTSVPYGWAYVSEQYYSDAAMTQPLTGAPTTSPGGKIYAQVKALNIGYKTWDPSFMRIGTWLPMDRTSAFQDSSWINQNRPAALSESSVSPGQVGTFNFVLKAPATTGTYNEHFNLVAENITWLNDTGLYFPVHVVSPVAPSAPSSTRPQLNAGDSLAPGQYLMSPDTQSVLVLQTDGNLVLYDDFQAVWNTNTVGRGKVLKMQTDGNLVLYDANSNALWNSQTFGNPGSYTKLQTDGNLATYHQNNTLAWSTQTTHNPDNLAFTNDTLPVGIMYPGQAIQTTNRKYSLILQTDGNLVLYSPNRALWNSQTFGKPVAYAAMQSDGNLVLYTANGGVVWDSRTFGKGPSSLVVQNDGNLVLYDQSGNATWNTKTYGQQ